MLNARWANFLGAFICHEMLAAALYFQYVQGLEPCPLCIFQRVVVFALGSVLLLKALHNPLPGSRWQWIYDIPALVISIVGIGIAGRHVYLQNLPESEIPDCGPALEYLMDVLPIMEVLNEVLTGSGECAEVSWPMLGISMPGWMLIAFMVAALIFVWRLWQEYREPQAVI